MRFFLRSIAAGLLLCIPVWAQQASSQKSQANAGSQQSSSAAGAGPAQAPAKKPPLSPRGSAEVELAGKKTAVDYGRPYLKGRHLGGPEIVPWGQVWRAGANEATGFTTAVDLDINGTHVPAGKYTLYILPEKDHWQLIVNKETGQWGTVYHQDQDLARIDMNLTQLSAPVEQFTISFDKKSESEAAMKFEWEATSASVTLKTSGPSDDRVRASNAMPAPGSLACNIDLISDTEGLNLAPYLQQVMSGVRSSWIAALPPSARPPQNKKGQVDVYLAIKREGELKGLKVEKSSGDEELDRAALTAISGSAPFPSLPTGFRAKEIVLRFHFHYNPKKA